MYLKVELILMIFLYFVVIMDWKLEVIVFDFVYRMMSSCNIFMSIFVGM